jgi:16S rRNA (adenine1518-N6/adenine1519-N6)-dimethyltransferase
LTHKARKRFGQNFLHDPAIIRQIVASVAPQPGERLVEIGPGRGAITTELLQAAGSLDVVELDRDLVQPLGELCAGLGNLRIHSADALKFDFCRLAQTTAGETGPGGGGLRVVGNLPYNISTPLLFHLLDQADCIRDLHFMLQKEVVERMAAGPGTKVYGRLSVMLQARCQVEPLFTIGPGAFNPPPKVYSAFVRLTPLRQPAPIDDRSCFSQLVSSAFSQRRKTLRNSLNQLVDATLIESVGIDPGLRAESLSVEDFIQLANAACKTSK